LSSFLLSKTDNEIGHEGAVDAVGCSSSVWNSDTSSATGKGTRVSCPSAGVEAGEDTHPPF
jgi:hypothetical protein